jgi:hypothetical protein
METGQASVRGGERLSARAIKTGASSMRFHRNAPCFRDACKPRKARAPAPVQTKADKRRRRPWHRAACLLTLPALGSVRVGREKRSSLSVFPVPSPTSQQAKPAAATSSPEKANARPGADKPKRRFALVSPPPPPSREIYPSTHPSFNPQPVIIQSPPGLGSFARAVRQSCSHPLQLRGHMARAHRQGLGF